MNINNEPTKTQIALAMQQYGGSFIQQLGRALQAADQDNAAIIRANWPLEWGRYSQLALREDKQ